MRGDLFEKFFLKVILVFEEFFYFDDFFKFEKELVIILFVVGIVVVFIIFFFVIVYCGISIFLVLIFDFFVMEVVVILRVMGSYVN